jgi:hypothetical protein
LLTQKTFVENIPDVEKDQAILTELLQTYKGGTSASTRSKVLGEQQELDSLGNSRKRGQLLNPHTEAKMRLQYPHLGSIPDYNMFDFQMRSAYTKNTGTEILIICRVYGLDINY